MLFSRQQKEEKFINPPIRKKPDIIRLNTEALSNGPDNCDAQSYSEKEKSRGGKSSKRYTECNELGGK